MDDVRIQIVNYKTKQYLFRCLETIFGDLKSSSITFHIAILDNASGDDLSDIPEKFPGRSIEIHHNETNVGFGAGHNILAKKGSAKYILLLNPDIELIEPRTIERLLHRIEVSKSEVVGPRLVTKKNHTTQHWDHGELYGFQARFAQSIGHSFWKERNEVSLVAWVSGAVFLIKKDWFERLDGFDEMFFLYNEEVELCFRLRALGGSVVYDPTIVVFHHDGIVAKKSEHLRTSRKYFLRKHFHRHWSYPLLQFINKIS